MNGTTYSYDSNGNMTYDGRRGLNVEYNLLNLPSEVENQADDMTARYTYLADATKLEVVDNDGCGYDYLGSLVYRKNDDDSYTLESTAFACGRIVRNSSGSYRLNGFVTDHLGSIRTVYDMETGEVLERNDYYPFGKRMNKSLAMSPTNRYRFSGKEEQVVADINLLDFGARMYDDEICRWTTVDPLAEKYYSMTPYNYCANNPVMFVDPEGKEKISWKFHEPTRGRGRYNNEHIWKKDNDRYCQGFGIRATEKGRNRAIDNFKNYKNILSIHGHGTNNGREIVEYLAPDNTPKIYNALQLKDYITNNSDLFSENSSNGKETIILLMSCETGDVLSDEKSKGQWNVFIKGEIVDNFSGTADEFKQRLDAIDYDPQKYIAKYAK